MSCLSYTSYDCVKSVRIRSYSGLRFPEFGLNMERYGISLGSCFDKELGVY